MQLCHRFNITLPSLAFSTIHILSIIQAFYLIPVTTCSLHLISIQRPIAVKNLLYHLLVSPSGCGCLSPTSALATSYQIPTNGNFRSLSTDLGTSWWRTWRKKSGKTEPNSQLSVGKVFWLHIGSFAKM